jgi:hypothetical protein
MDRIRSCFLVGGLLLAMSQGAGAVTVFEGARLITGDGTVIENSAFLVDGTQFSLVGRRGDLKAPNGAARVDLTGKTVMPAKVDLHGHIGFQHDVDGTMAKEYYTRENLVDHLQRLAYYGFSAIIGIGDLVDRSDLHGGRTNWGDVPLRARRNQSWRGIVSHGRHRNRLAGVGRERPPLAHGRSVSSDHRGRSTRRRR